MPATAATSTVARCFVPVLLPRRHLRPTCSHRRFPISNAAEPSSRGFRCFAQLVLTGTVEQDQEVAEAGAAAF
jgi:hypothetical protein